MITASPEPRKRKLQPRARKAYEPVSPAPESGPEPVHYCEDRHERISQRAYALYVERGYRDGCSLQDWLDAEREILSREQPV